MELETLGKWIIFAIVLVVLIIGINTLLAEKGGNIITEIKNLIRIGK